MSKLPLCAICLSVSVSLPSDGCQGATCLLQHRAGSGVGRTTTSVVSKNETKNSAKSLGVHYPARDLAVDGQRCCTRNAPRELSSFWQGLRFS